MFREFRRRKYDKPYALPLISYENVSDPGAYGAYFKNTFDFASILRDQDVSTQRMSMINSWNLPYTSPYGEKYRMVASVKSDAYYVDNYTNPDNKKIYRRSRPRIPAVGLGMENAFCSRH